MSAEPRWVNNGEKICRDRGGSCMIHSNIYILKTDVLHMDHIWCDSEIETPETESDMSIKRAHIVI